MNLVFDGPLVEWAAEHIPDAPKDPFGEAVAVGVASEGRLLAVCVYHNYVPEHHRCEISFASTSPRWARRGIIRALLSIPFEQYGLSTIYTFTPETNARALRFNEGIGLTDPVTIPDYCGPGKSAVVRRMTRETYLARWRNS